MNRKEVHSNRVWLLVFSIIVVTVTSIPYLVAFETQGEDWRFTGFVFGVEDGNSYIGKMLRGASGDWLFRTPYSSIDQKGVIAFLPYLLLGKLSAPPGQHIQLVALFHLFRAVGIFLFIFASDEFARQWITRIYLRRWAVILMSLGGGLGWVLLLAGRSTWLGWIPLEFYSPESFGFLALYGLPHLVFSRALMLKGFSIILSSHQTARGLKAGACWLGMGFFQPLNVVTTWVVLGTYGLLNVIIYYTGKKSTPGRDFPARLMGRIWTAGWISSPIVIYTLVRFQSDPFLKGWSAQNIVLSPPPGHYLLAYGLMLPFALVGFLSSRKEPTTWLLGGWLLILPVLIYAPYPLQRRLAEGAWAAVVVLGVKSLDSIEHEPRKLLQWSWGLTLPSTIILLAGGTAAALHPALPLFRPANEVKAFQFFAEEGRSNSSVLSSYQSGNALPAWAPVFVVAGHGSESLDSRITRQKIKEFFHADSLPGYRHNLFDEYDVDYLFWGPEERSLGAWNPHESPYLDLLYDEDGYAVFQVQR